MQKVHPSVKLVAACSVAFLPGAQFIAAQVVVPPPDEYVPSRHIEQPSVSVLAPVLVAIYPAGHPIGAHVVLLSPVE